MNEYFASLANTLEELTGIKGALGVSSCGK